MLQVSSVLALSATVMVVTRGNEESRKSRNADTLAAS